MLELVTQTFVRWNRIELSLTQVADSGQRSEPDSSTVAQASG
jgi:hypothetical protein